jgi:hypothetical protein
LRVGQLGAAEGAIDTEPGRAPARLATLGLEVQFIGVRRRREPSTEQPM